MPDATAAITALQGFAQARDERESMEYDVVIVGAGPAGLAAAIRLKQKSPDISVCILEKGSEVGAHILSGAVMEPGPLAELWPSWREDGAPLSTPVSKDKILFLGKRRAMPVPQLILPPLMKNHGNYIISLGNLCRWLATKAEAMGVEIYPGFAAAEVLFDDNGRVAGVATGDMGIAKDGSRKSGFTPGVAIKGKYTLFGEGARGSLSKFLIQHFKLDADCAPQKYGLGLKELWRVQPEKHRAGFVQHTLGWPLGNKTSGGSFIYHFDKDLVAVGFIVHLDYKNPHLSPFDEFQRFKTHAAIRPLLEGGERIAYGARAIASGGLQSVPKLVFPGGALIGCAAGFVNFPKIKGSHNAIATGMMAADACAAALAETNAGTSTPDMLETYEKAWRKSAVFKELKVARNLKPFLARFGLLPGVLFGGADMWMRTLRIGLPFTLKHAYPDFASLARAKDMPPIAYPKPDGKVSFDKLSSVFLSGVNHEEDQPAHLTLQDADIPVAYNLPEYDEPAQRYCPAGVYEIVGEGENARLQINAQNCVHCKTCDIKDPKQNINWVVPEGGGGPNYPNM